MKLDYKKMKLEELVNAYISLSDEKKADFDPNKFVKEVAVETELRADVENPVIKYSSKKNKNYIVKKRFDKEGSAKRKDFDFYSAKSEFFKVYRNDFEWDNYPGQASEKAKADADAKKKSLLSQIGITLD